jgi:hypothetical protein
MSVREMILYEMSQRLLQLRGVHQIAALLSGPDIVDHHVAHQQFAAWPADQAVSKLQSNDLRKMLMLGNSPNLLLAKLAEAETILERQHGGPSVSRSSPTDLVEKTLRPLLH